MLKEPSAKFNVDMSQQLTIISEAIDLMRKLNTLVASCWWEDKIVETGKEGRDKLFTIISRAASASLSQTKSNESSST